MTFLTNAANHLITPQHLEKHIDLLKTASYLLADANINVDTAEWLLAFSNETGIPFVIETASVPPAKKYKPVNLSGTRPDDPVGRRLPEKVFPKANWEYCLQPCLR